MTCLRHSPALLAAAIILTAAAAPTPAPSISQDPAAAPSPAPGKADIKYICPPCGAQCHDRFYDAAGNCSVCGMTLVESTTVPRIGVLVFDGVDLLAFTGPAGVFARSDRVFVNTVADTTDPIGSQEVITLTPSFSFDDAPEFQVLILAGGGNIRDIAGDTYITRWVAKRVEAADHVLCVGLGSLILHATGALEGKAIPVPSFIASRAEQFIPGSTADTEQRMIDHGKIKLARDEAAAIEMSLRILAELTDDETAKRTAGAIGFTYTAAAAAHEGRR